MKCEQRPLNNLEPPAAGFDRIIDWLLTALLVFMPFAFGAVHAWSEQVVIALSGVILFCFLLKLISRQGGIFKWSWSYLPIGLFILVAVFQLIELPAALINILSANTGSIKTQLLGQLPNSEQLLGSMTVSFYPNATLHNLRLVLSVAAVFVVVLNTYRTPDRIKRLLGSIAVVGGAVALLALAQDILATERYTGLCHAMIMHTQVHL